MDSVTIPERTASAYIRWYASPQRLYLTISFTSCGGANTGARFLPMASKYGSVIIRQVCKEPHGQAVEAAVMPITSLSRCNHVCDPTENRSLKQSEAELAKPIRGGKWWSGKSGMIACNLLPHFHISSSQNIATSRSAVAITVRFNAT